MTYIIILCKDWQDSCDNFDIFVDYLLKYNPDSILYSYDSSNIVDTVEYFGDLGEELFRYVFVDYHYENWFDSERDDIRIVDADNFFDGVLEFYQWEF